MACSIGITQKMPLLLLWVSALEPGCCGYYLLKITTAVLVRPCGKITAELLYHALPVEVSAMDAVMW